MQLARVPGSNLLKLEIVFAGSIVLKNCTIKIYSLKATTKLEFTCTKNLIKSNSQNI